MKTAFASFLLWTGALALLGFVALLCAIAASIAHAAEVPVTVCARLPLPGPELILNPHDPPARQVRETALVCERITVPGRDLNPTKTRADYRRDPRSFA